MMPISKHISVALFPGCCVRVDPLFGKPIGGKEGKVISWEFTSFCESGIMVVIDIYERSIDSNWLTIVPTSTLEPGWYWAKQRDSLFPWEVVEVTGVGVFRAGSFGIYTQSDFDFRPLPLQCPVPPIP